MQGGIHPSFTGENYVRLLRGAARRAGSRARLLAPGGNPRRANHGRVRPGVHRQAQRRGSGIPPGTAAEVLDDAVRAELCPDKISAKEWLDVVSSARRGGADHVDHDVRTRGRRRTTRVGHAAPRPRARARRPVGDVDASASPPSRRPGSANSCRCRSCTSRRPCFARGDLGAARRFASACSHAVARLVLGPAGMTNVQASWVKMGPEMAAHLLDAGCNDLGGTLANEHHASGGRDARAGDVGGAMEAIIEAAGRTARTRTTLYGDAGRKKGGARGETPRRVSRRRREMTRRNETFREHQVECACGFHPTIVASARHRSSLLGFPAPSSTRLRRRLRRDRLRRRRRDRLRRRHHHHHCRRRRPSHPPRLFVDPWTAVSSAGAALSGDRSLCSLTLVAITSCALVK